MVVDGYCDRAPGSVLGDMGGSWSVSLMSVLIEVVGRCSTVEYMPWHGVTDFGTCFAMVWCVYFCSCDKRQSPLIFEWWTVR